MLRERRRMNRPKFKNIIWTRKGKPVKFPQEVLDDFISTGLSNTDFISMKFWICREILLGGWK